MILCAICRFNVIILFTAIKRKICNFVAFLALWKWQLLTIIHRVECCALAWLCKTKLAVVIESQASLTFQCWKLANQSHTSLSLSSPNMSERMWTSPDLVSLSNGDCRPRLRWLHAIAAEFTTSMISNISIIAFIKSNAIFFCFNIWFSLAIHLRARDRSRAARVRQSS